MDNISEETRYNFKGLFKYISTIMSWTIFVLLSIVGILLLYYFISVRLYAAKGDAFEPQFSVYTIVSPSMEPTISVYDVIINTKINKIDDVKINDVITFISTWDVTQGMTITHRVVGKKTLDDGSVCLVTRGDNNTQEDQACVKEGNIIGITKAVIPSLGRLQFFLSSKMGLLLVIILPALYIVVKSILRILHLTDNLKKINKDEHSEDNRDEKKDNKELEEKYKYLKEVKKNSNKK